MYIYTDCPLDVMLVGVGANVNWTSAPPIVVLPMNNDMQIAIGIYVPYSKELS